MNRYIIETHTPLTPQEVLDHFKANGGHANLINVRPEIPPERVPAFVLQPYPPEAYEITEVDPATLPPDCPYCDGTGNISSPEDLAVAVRDRHPGFNDAEVDAEVARVHAEIDAQSQRWVRNRERIQAELARSNQ